MVESLVEAWRVNHRVTMKMIDGLSPAAMKATLSTRGGRDVARQLAHIHWVRTAYLKKADMPEGITEFAKGESPPAAQLKVALEESADAVERFIRRAWANGGEVPGFKRDIVTLLAYLIAHEGHHRGSILLTAKQTGHPLDEKVRWALWAWDSI
jgi:uncharacterized damage-inducible protein DinB